jgi:hypothetical protein
MWYKAHWTNYREPFVSNKELLNLLKSTLHLSEAVEGGNTYSFRVRIDPNKIIKKITLKDNPSKNGTPVIDGLYFVKGTPQKKLDNGQIRVLERGSFFDSHTIDIKDPYPDTIKEALVILKSAVTVQKEELKEVKQYTFPNDYSGTRVLFSGNEFALAASNIFNYNIGELARRVGPDGFLHESSSENYNYSYDGFGTYTYSKKGSYYNFFYSRNKAIFLLNHYGERKLAKKAMDYANNALMYFKNNKLQINGIDIPGHWTIHVNNPMAYAEGSYPTQYTKDRFGDDYKNIGNSENDGHGMMMLSMYNTWKNAGSHIEWIHEHFEYIKEAASWIVWNFEHPTLSFMKNDVLYSESEGANWKGYSLYCNIPCYYGLKAYADMAKAAGYEKEAEEWYSYVDRLKKGILNNFVTKDGIWDTSKDGYPRDPVLFTMMYYHGYDTEDMDRDFLEISLRTYKRDINNILACGGYFAAYGTGYDHGVITQNALLTDNIKDATNLLENLSLVCYSPNQPNPYAVPECYAVDTKLNIVRRQGDLGNLIQMSEVLAAYNLVIGVSPFDVESGILKILPRLPEGWSMEVRDFLIENTQSILNLKSDIYTVELSFDNMDLGIREIRYRLGPFPQDTKKVQVFVNGKKVSLDTFKSGDSTWAWLSLNPEEETFSISVSNTGNNSGLDNKLGAITIPLIVTAIVLSSLFIYLKLKLKGGKTSE